MLIIDGHEDIAYNALAWGRDIRLSAYAIREREAQASTGHAANPGGIAMSGLPELRRGGVGIVFGVIFAYPLHNANYKGGGNSQTYSTTEEAHKIGQEQFAYYRELAREPGISLVLNQDDLKKVLNAWEQAAEDDKERPFGIIPLMEGADPIRTPGEVAQWFATGLRAVGLAWQGTRYSGGTHMPGPLTPDGKALLTEMERAGMILDTSHLAEESFWQGLEHFHGPVMASHSNCRALTPTDRHLSDDMIHALAARDAVIGVVIGNAFLDSRWSHANRFTIGLDQVVRHIDHICQLTGNTRHVAIGSDIDGGFGRDETPTELDTATDLAKLADVLFNKGYVEEDVVRVMSGNWRRFLERALPS